MRPLLYLARFRRSKLVLIIGGFVTLLVLIILLVTVIKPKADVLFQAEATPHYPSLKYAGYLVNNGDQTSYQWDVNHYDYINSGNLTHKQLSPNTPVTKYTVLRYLSPFSTTNYTLLRDYATSHNAKFEDMFIHFSEDTTLKMDSARTHPEDDFYAVVYLSGSTYSNKGDWYSSPSTFTFGSQAGEFLFLGMMEKFDEVNFTLQSAASGNWNMDWQYFNGSSWVNLNVSDGTNKLRNNGRVSFVVPGDWQMTTVGGGDSRISNLPMYLVRLRSTQTGTAPSLRGSGSGGGIQGADYVKLTDSANNYYQYSGWDEVADANHDGYLDPVSEYPNRAANKNARFKYWSRLPGREFANNLSYNFNQGSTLFKDAFVALSRELVNQSQGGQSYDGIYFDESIGGLDPWLTWQSSSNPISGGTTFEYGKIGSSTVNTTWNNDYVANIAAIRSALANLGKTTGINLGRSYFANAEKNVDYIMRELVFYGTSNYGHLTNIADQNSLAGIMLRDHQNGVISLIQHQRGGLGNFLGHTEEVEHRDNYFGLASFYCLQNTTSDYFTSWSGDYYTSPTGPSEFVPTVSANIGTPTGIIPTGFSAISGPDSKMFLFASGTDPASNTPYKVIARDYSKGLVISRPRTDTMAENSTNYGDVSKVTFNLPQLSDNPSGRYFLVGYDGTISGTAITSITLRNAEGAILIKESAMTGVSLSKSVSKSSAASGETITYTINYQVGNQAVTSAKIEDPVPSGTSFVSAANGGTSNGTTITWNLGNLAIGAKGSVSFQAKIK